MFIAAGNGSIFDQARQGGGTRWRGERWAVAAAITILCPPAFPRLLLLLLLFVLLLGSPERACPGAGVLDDDIDGKQLSVAVAQNVTEYHVGNDNAALAMNLRIYACAGGGFEAHVGQGFVQFVLVTEFFAFDEGLRRPDRWLSILVLRDAEDEQADGGKGVVKCFETCKVLGRGLVEKGVTVAAFDGRANDYPLLFKK